MTNLLMVNSIPASGRDFVPNAQDISDKLASLRDLLVQQMHSGIEPAVPTSEPESSSEDNSFSNSDYQESESVKILSAPSHQQSNSSAFVHNALKKNKILQDKIKHMLLKLDDEIRVCSQKISELFSMSTISRKKLLNSRNLLGFPSLIDQEGDIPNENPDVPKLLKIAQRVPCFHLVVPWSKEELSSLKDGVWSFTKILHTQRIIEQYTSGGQTELSQKEMEKMKQELHDLADFVRRGSRNAKKEFSNALDVIGNTMSHHTIDWDAIAKAFVPSRSGLDCQIRWLGNDDPRVNFGEWKTEETRDLLELVKEHGGRNWSVIAKELNTGRTAMQCFQRYQSTHNPRMIKREFTPEEDAKILELVERYGSNWDEISTHIPGRTASQLNHRYNNTSRQCIRSGNWTEEEDIKLILAHEAYTKWTEISSLLPGRTGMKCRERYMNVLDPNANQTKHCPWTKDETDRLFQLVSLYGAGNWSKIAEGMVTRTDNQCYRRWRNVAAKRTPKEYETYRKKIQVKKKAVLNNFVGRKRNRPNEISLVDLSGIVESDQEIEDDEMQSFTTDQFPKIAKISDCCP